MAVATQEQLAVLSQLFIDNNWAMIVGDDINDCLYCDGFKSITVHNNENGFVMSILFNEKLLKKFYSVEEALSDALLTYFIREYAI